MADFGLGTYATGRVEAWENWNSSTQVSMHFKLSCEIRSSAYNTTGPTAGPYYDLMHVGTGYWTYSSNGWRTVREGDATFNKDANGYVNITVYGHLNGKNSPYVTANQTSYNYAPARIGIAPTIVANISDTITSTSVRLGTEISSVGLGTSAATRMYYKKPADGSWTATSDQNDVGGYNYWTITGLTPNQKYYRLARWWNNNTDTSNLPSTYPSESYVFYTLPAAATIGTITPLATTATMPYTQATDGAAYTITTQYRIKVTGGTYGAWVTATGGTINLTGLLPNTNYTIQTQSTTTAGTTTGAEYTFLTLPAGKLVYPDGQVKNAIPRLVHPNGTVEMVNINLVE